MSKEITLEIKVVNEFGQESIETFRATYEKLLDNEWNEIVIGLLDESVSEKEF